MTNIAWLLGLEVALLTVCVLGDHVTFDVQLSALPLWFRIFTRAVLDSSVHGNIAAVSWLVVRYDCAQSGVVLGEAAVCGALSMLIDSDHFLAARSLRLKDALSLPARPPLHNSTLMFVITILIHATNFYFCDTAKQNDLSVVNSYLPQSWISKGVISTLTQSLMQCITWLFLTAWTSHHVRDGSRRGLWLAPAGSTPPLRRSGYVLITLLIPLVVRTFVMYYQPHVISTRTVVSSRQAVENV